MDTVNANFNFIPSPSPEEKTAAPAMGRGEQILVVDDESVRQLARSHQRGGLAGRGSDGAPAFAVCFMRGVLRLRAEKLSLIAQLVEELASAGDARLDGLKVTRQRARCLL